MAESVASKLMDLVRRDKDSISRSNRVILVFISHETFSFQDIHFMFPVMFVKRCMSSRLNGKMSHGKGWGSNRFVNQPLDLNPYSSIFLNGRVFLPFDVDLGESHRDHIDNFAPHPLIILLKPPNQAQSWLHFAGFFGDISWSRFPKDEKGTC
jgi:hypothetical protein